MHSLNAQTHIASLIRQIQICIFIFTTSFLYGQNVTFLNNNNDNNLNK